MIRFLNFLVIGMLIAAATYVYRIKYEATEQAGRIAKLKIEIARERDAIVDLKATWADYNRPERLQALAEKHLQTRPIAIPQITRLDNLPEKVIFDPDPIGSMLEAMGVIPADDIQTGTLSPGKPAPAMQKAPLPAPRQSGGR